MIYERIRDCSKLHIRGQYATVFPLTNWNTKKSDICNDVAVTLKRCICRRRNIKHKSSGKFEFESTVRELARKKLQKYWKSPGIFRFLLSYFYPWKFQTKQNFPTGNSAKLCCYYPLRPKTKTTTRFTPVNSVSFLINPWKFHLLPSVTLEIPYPQPNFWSGIAQSHEFT